MAPIPQDAASRLIDKLDRINELWATIKKELTNVISAQVATDDEDSSVVQVLNSENPHFSDTSDSSVVLDNMYSEVSCDSELLELETQQVFDDMLVKKNDVLESFDLMKVRADHISSNEVNIFPIATNIHSTEYAQLDHESAVLHNMLSSTVRVHIGWIEYLCWLVERRECKMFLKISNGVLAYVRWDPGIYDYVFYQLRESHSNQKANDTSVGASNHFCKVLLGNLVVYSVILVRLYEPCSACLYSLAQFIQWVSHIWLLDTSGYSLGAFTLVANVFIMGHDSCVSGCDRQRILMSYVYRVLFLLICASLMPISILVKYWLRRQAMQGIQFCELVIKYSVPYSSVNSNRTVLVGFDYLLMSGAAGCMNIGPFALNHFLSDVYNPRCATRSNKLLVRLPIAEGFWDCLCLPSLRLWIGNPLNLWPAPMFPSVQVTKCKQFSTFSSKISEVRLFAGISQFFVVEEYPMLAVQCSNFRGCNLGLQCIREYTSQCTRHHISLPKSKSWSLLPNLNLYSHAHGYMEIFLVVPFIETCDVSLSGVFVALIYFQKYVHSAVEELEPYFARCGQIIQPSMLRNHVASRSIVADIYRWSHDSIIFYKIVKMLLTRYRNCWFSNSLLFVLSTGTAKSSLHMNPTGSMILQLLRSTTSGFWEFWLAGTDKMLCFESSQKGKSPHVYNFNCLRVLCYRRLKFQDPYAVAIKWDLGTKYCSLTRSFCDTNINVVHWWSFDPDTPIIQVMHPLISLLLDYCFWRICDNQVLLHSLFCDEYHKKFIVATACVWLVQTTYKGEFSRVSCVFPLVYKYHSYGVYVIYADVAFAMESSSWKFTSEEMSIPYPYWETTKDLVVLVATRFSVLFLWCAMEAAFSVMRVLASMQSVLSMLQSAVSLLPLPTHSISRMFDFVYINSNRALDTYIAKMDISTSLIYVQQDGYKADKRILWCYDPGIYMFRIVLLFGLFYIQRTGIQSVVVGNSPKVPAIVLNVVESVPTRGIVSSKTFHSIILVVFTYLDTFKAVCLFLEHSVRYFSGCHEGGSAGANVSQELSQFFKGSSKDVQNQMTFLGSDYQCIPQYISTLFPSMWLSTMGRVSSVLCSTESKQSLFVRVDALLLAFSYVDSNSCIQANGNVKSLWTVKYSRRPSSLLYSATSEVRHKVWEAAVRARQYTQQQALAAGQLYWCISFAKLLGTIQGYRVPYKDCLMKKRATAFISLLHQVGDSTLLAWVWRIWFFDPGIESRTLWILTVRELSVTSSVNRLILAYSGFKNSSVYVDQGSLAYNTIHHILCAIITSKKNLYSKKASRFMQYVQEYQLDASIVKAAVQVSKVIVLLFFLLLATRDCFSYSYWTVLQGGIVVLVTICTCHKDWDDAPTDWLLHGLKHYVGSLCLFIFHGQLDQGAVSYVNKWKRDTMVQISSFAPICLCGQAAAVIDYSPIYLCGQAAAVRAHEDHLLLIFDLEDKVNSKRGVLSYPMTSPSPSVQHTSSSGPEEQYKPRSIRLSS